VSSTPKKSARKVKPTKKAVKRVKRSVEAAPQDMAFNDWMAYGIRKGWCGAPVCSTHDGIPMSESENDEWFEKGNDICVHIVRMYDGPENKAAVEREHGPSNWRNFYTQ
jgi:hypothetical protein